MSDNIKDMIKHVICGGVGGVCIVLVGHPFDTIKVRLQTQNRSASEKPLFKGTIGCTLWTLRNEGIRGLYKGMGAPLVIITPIISIVFTSYKIGLDLFGPPKGTRFSFWDYYKAGMFAGFAQTPLMGPGERVKCLLQVQDSTKKAVYKGPVDCLWKIFKEGGLRSVFKGTFATLLRDTPARGGYFSSYECSKRYFKEMDIFREEFIGVFFAGGIAGLTHWCIAMPMDVLKSRLQAAPEGTYPNGLRDVVISLLNKEGPTAFFRGLTPVLLRAFPANAACLIGFELSMKFMNVLWP